ncbi:class I SAM-dependent methyltransferase [Methylomonas sp. SURF-1]|uniref:Class I SAM-dependent methyltransferase n=1 Tax=Methylomonas aurea TaxID=2952224 RepID=A0ABT1UM09_9GAMM|nr:class I SAM-dependent methyltransferase [Methylomonas sp. SURF-1]MCQ8183071.1 class I SAM-dependent methyltransferase [Methylomonas sp. SURF-1]
MSADNPFDAMFSGVIGREYDMLKLISPIAPEMSRLVGLEVADFCQGRDGRQQVVELGGGTGITTLAILSSAENCQVLSVDSEPTMQNQAKQNLQEWAQQGRLEFSGRDALSALKALPERSADMVASAYTLHNFEAGYRRQVLAESYRILKPGGKFVNGDRYALDDIDRHTRATQQEVAGYFKVLTGINRLDLLEHWIIHLFSDESENHVMRESIALAQMAEVGFCEIQLKRRIDVNALVTGSKAAE